MHKKFNINLLNRRRPKKKWLCIMLLVLCCLPHLLAAPCGDVNSDNTVNIVDALMTANCVTVSWNHFHNTNKTTLVGHSDGNGDQDRGYLVEAQILLEASYFENQGNQTWYDWSNSGTAGRIQWTADNVFDNTTISTWAPNSNVFDPPYEYLNVKQTAVEAKVSVMQYAGVM